MVMASFPTIPKEYLLRRIISKEAMTGNTFFSGLPRRFCRKNNSGSGQKRFLVRGAAPCRFGFPAQVQHVIAVDPDLASYFDRGNLTGADTFIGGIPADPQESAEFFDRHHEGNIVKIRRSWAIGLRCRSEMLLLLHFFHVLFLSFWNHIRMPGTFCAER